MFFGFLLLGILTLMVAAMASTTVEIICDTLLWRERDAQYIRSRLRVYAIFSRGVLAGIDERYFNEPLSVIPAAMAQAQVYNSHRY